MQLIFVSVWFYWWAKHIPCLCLPCLWHSRSFWGWALHPVELSALPMEQAQVQTTTDLKEGAEWVPAQGWPAWGSGVRGEEMYPRTAPVAGEVPTPATGQFWRRAGEWSECLTLSSASLACPWPSFPGGHPQNCHHLSPGNDFPYTCTQQRHRKVSLLTQRSRLLATSKLNSLQSVVSSQKIKYY